MDIREYALSILKYHGCQDDCYYGDTTERVCKDLMLAYPNGMEYGFSYDQVAGELINIANDVPKIPKEITEISDGFDVAHWGATDLYPDAEEKLRKLLESGTPFNTGWCSCKKELISFCIGSDGKNHIHVEVCESMDDFPDIIYDAYESLYKKYCDLSEGAISEIDEACHDIVTEWTEEQDLPINASYNNVMDSISHLCSKTRDYLDGQFEMVKNNVRFYVEEYE